MRYYHVNFDSPSYNKSLARLEYKSMFCVFLSPYTKMEVCCAVLWICFMRLKYEINKGVHSLTKQLLYAEAVQHANNSAMFYLATETVYMPIQLSRTTTSSLLSAPEKPVAIRYNDPVRNLIFMKV